jgi:hypothetical protein
MQLMDYQKLEKVLWIHGLYSILSSITLSVLQIVHQPLFLSTRLRKTGFTNNLKLPKLSVSKEITLELEMLKAFKINHSLNEDNNIKMQEKISYQHLNNPLPDDIEILPNFFIKGFFYLNPLLKDNIHF